MHCHWAESKPPDNSNGCIFFTLRLKLRYSVQLWQVFFNTVYPAQGFKIFCLFSRLLGICTLSSLGVLGFQLLQKLDPGSIGLIFWMSVCVCVWFCAQGQKHLSTYKFQHPWTIPVVFRSSTAANRCILAAEQSHLLISLFSLACPCRSCQSNQYIYVYIGMCCILGWQGGHCIN